MQECFSGESRLPASQRKLPSRVVFILPIALQYSAAAGDALHYTPLHQPPLRYYNTVQQLVMPSSTLQYTPLSISRLRNSGFSMLWSGPSSRELDAPGNSTATASVLIADLRCISLCNVSSMRLKLTRESWHASCTYQQSLKLQGTTAAAAATPNKLWKWWVRIVVKSCCDVSVAVGQPAGAAAQAVS